LHLWWALLAGLPAAAPRWPGVVSYSPGRIKSLYGPAIAGDWAGELNCGASWTAKLEVST